MSYQKVIDKFNQIYRKASLDEILSLWAQYEDTVNVYVHSPFCASICKFCHYKGIKFDANQDNELYRKYYYNYLPKTIEPFLPIIAKNKIGNYFFGGGTPSLMRPETMRFVFDLFPGFKKLKSKTFEIHPATYDDEQLDVLAEYGFNCAIIGIQSFDKAVLQRQRRQHASFDEISLLVEKIKDRGLYVAGDIIYRMDDIDEDKIFAQDLKLLEKLPLDIISLQLHYDFKFPNINSRFLELIKNSALPNDYYWSESNRRNDLPDVVEIKEMKCLRMVRNEIPKGYFYSKIFNFMISLDEISKQSIDQGGSVIGFGSYQNPRKNTFSNFYNKKKHIEYIEVNNNWQAEYYITYDLDQVSAFNDFIDGYYKKLQLLGKPPEGVSLNTIKARVRQDKHIFRSRDTQAMMIVRWSKRNKEIDGYLNSLQEKFPQIRLDPDATNSKAIF